jgi:hypothetical protein
MSEAHLAQSFMPAILTHVPARLYFLTRPQRLTHIDPLPVERDMPAYALNRTGGRKPGQKIIYSSADLR